MWLGLWRTSRHPCMTHVSSPTQWRLVKGVRSTMFAEVLHVLLLYRFATFLQEVWHLMVLLMKRIHERPTPTPSKFQSRNIFFVIPCSQVWPGSISSWSLSSNKITCKSANYNFIVMGRLDSFEVPRSVLTKLDFESCSKTVLFEVDRTRGNQVQRTDTTVEKEISGEPLMIFPVWYAMPQRSWSATRFVGFTGRGESVSLVGKVGDSELLLLRCCFLLEYVSAQVSAT